MSVVGNEILDDRAVSVVSGYCDAWLAGDKMSILSFYHPDLTLHWPGRHHLAGVHQGHGPSISALIALQAITNRIPLRIVEVLAGRASVMVVVIERWSDTDREIELKRGLEFTVRDDKLHTCRLYETDQPAIDDWIATHSDASAPSANAATLDRASQGWANRDVDTILSFHTETTVFHHHGVADPQIGQEAVRAAFSHILETNRALAMVKQKTTFGVNHAIVEYQVTATIDGHTTTAPAVDVFTFRDGLIDRKDTWVTPLRPTP